MTTRDANTILERLRDLLHRQPDKRTWEALCACFEEVREPEFLNLCLDYALPLLDQHWPDELRAPPEPWRRLHLEGHTPPVWPMVRTYDLRLDSPGSRRIAVIKTLRTFKQIGLKEAVGLTGTVPALIGADMSHSEAAHFRDALKKGGARAQIIARPPMVLSYEQVLEAAAGWPPRKNHDLRLLDAGDKKILVIKALRYYTHCSLSEAKALISELPATAASGLPFRTAVLMKQSILEAGGRAELVTTQKRTQKRTRVDHLGGWNG